MGYKIVGDKMIKGFIFDLDGVITSTDEFHYLAWKKLAEQLGINNFTKEDNLRQRGVSRMESLEVVLEKSDKTYSLEEKKALADYKNSIYKALLEKMDSSYLSDEVKTTLEALKKKGYRLAIGSSSKNAKYILYKLGLDDFFDAVSDGNNITKSKPDPEVFLKAKDMLGLKACECVVVEDAISGIDAANSGGFYSVGIGPASHYKKACRRIKKFSSLLKIK